MKKAYRCSGFGFIEDAFRRFRHRPWLVFITMGLVFLSPAYVHPSGTEPKARFTFQRVVEQARQLAKEDYRQPGAQIPPLLAALDYDQWRDIRFKAEHALWRRDKLSFTVQFFHPGMLYDRPVQINMVDSAGVHPIAFSPELFDYGRNDFKEKVPRLPGFAGFRLHYPLNTKDYYDEVAVFIGGSYLRAVAEKLNYGQSARALAIDMALRAGEEFPYFREFWLLRPAVEAKEMIVFALLESPSVTGAYRFIIRPGKETAIVVHSTIFRRKKVEKLCIAPLTSMFFYGENTNLRPGDDFRPEVHDTDGLMIVTDSGERIWRPLVNPRTLLVNSFHVQNLRGFGLIQRDQDFDHYQDLEANYQFRPSVWITPNNNWGAGRIELVQIPTPNEMNDNIAVFWIPSRAPAVKEPFSFSYKMAWHSAADRVLPGGRVVATRTAKHLEKEKEVVKFLVDFAGEKLESLPADTPLTGVLSVGPGARVVEQQLYKNRITGGWRLVFQISIEEPGSIERVMPDTKPALELRAFLKQGESALTETWSYAYQP